MRRDLGKVILEAGKHDTAIRKNRRKDLKEDHIPSREKMSQTKEKWTHSNHNVFRKMLEKSVGRPWNKVYSEMRKPLNKSNHEQMDCLARFISWRVATNIQEIRTINKVKVPVDSENDLIYNSWWVHPVTGLIMSPVAYPKRKTDSTVPSYINIKGRFYRVCYPKDVCKQVEDGELEPEEAEGFWFEVEFENLPGSHKLQFGKVRFVVNPSVFPCKDAIAGTLNNAHDAQTYHGNLIRATKKRQLNSNEIKRLGLHDRFAGTVPRKKRYD